MITAVLRFLSAIAGLFNWIGLLLRVVVLGFLCAAVLRIGGYAEPAMLPAFWLILGLATLLVAGPAWAGGYDEARRNIRDAAIRKAEKDYQDGR